MSLSGSNEPFAYVAWVRNHQFPKGDEDYEFPICLVIHAVSAEKAQEWGDYLSKKHCEEIELEEFLWSSIETLAQSKWTINDEYVPCIQYGDKIQI